MKFYRNLFLVSVRRGRRTRLALVMNALKTRIQASPTHTQLATSNFQIELILRWLLLTVASNPGVLIWRRGVGQRLVHTVVRMHLISEKSRNIAYPANFPCNGDVIFVEFLQPQYSLVWLWRAVRVLCLVVHIFRTCVIRSSEVSDFAYICCRCRTYV